MLKPCRIFQYWLEANVAAKDMFLLLQEEPTPAAEEGLQDGVLVFLIFSVGVIKGRVFHQVFPNHLNVCGYIGISNLRVGFELLRSLPFDDANAFFG